VTRSTSTRAKEVKKGTDVEMQDVELGGEEQADSDSTEEGTGTKRKRSAKNKQRRLKRIIHQNG
jgi:hypothetical protein